MEDQKIIVKLMYFQLDKKAPKKYSCFYKKVTSNSIVGLVNYTEREEALAADSVFKKDSSFLSYTERSSASLSDKVLTYTNKGILKDDKEKKIWKNEIKNYLDDLENKKDKDIKNSVYQLIISFKDHSHARKHNLFNFNDYVKRMDKIIPVVARELNIKKENFIFWINLHENKSKNGEVHPHLHFQFFDKEYNSLNKIPIKTFRRIKNYITKEFKQEHFFSLTEFKTKENYYLEKIKNYNEMIHHINSLDINKIKNIKVLLKNLPSTGRLSYNSYHLKKFKPLIDKEIDKILNSNKFKKEYNNYLDILDEYEKFYKANNIKTNFKKENIKKLKSAIANDILKKLKSLKTRNKKQKESFINTINNKNTKHVNLNLSQFKKENKNKLLDALIDDKINYNLVKVSNEVKKLIEEFYNNL